MEAQTLLAGYLLSSQGDRVAMANSIEGRFPYLDHRVIEFANRLPPSFKIRGMTEKYLLRRALADLLPEEIVNRTKQPYRAPDSQSFFFDGQAAGLRGGPDERRPDPRGGILRADGRIAPVREVPARQGHAGSPTTRLSSVSCPPCWYDNRPRPHWAGNGVIGLTVVTPAAIRADEPETE